MKVGFIGLGIMGKPMAENLVKAGYELIVTDINRASVAETVRFGAEEGSYCEIGAQADVIIIMVPNGEITKRILFGTDGVINTIKPGSIVCDMSSVTPEESRYCYETLKEAGIGFVDAPVSGGETGAVNGELAIMAGGERKDFEALSDIFYVLGKHAVYIGGPGSGSIAKLANQIIVNNNIAVVSEALVFAVKAGADPEKVFQAIRGGLAGSAVLNAKAPMMLEHNFKPGGPIRINHKDIRNVIDTAHSLDVPIPYTAQLYEIMQALVVHGCINDDHAGIIQYFEKLADIEVRRTQ